MIKAVKQPWRDLISILFIPPASTMAKEITQGAKLRPGQLVSVPVLVMMGIH